MIHHQNRSSHKVWRLWPWLLLQPTAVHQVNLLLLPLQEQGDINLASNRRRGAIRHARDTFRSLAKSNGKAQVVPPFHHLQPHRRTLLWNDEAYSLLLQTTMDPLPHGLWSCSSKPLTGRTGHQLKDASTTGTTGDTTASTGIVSPTTGQGLVS